MVSLFLIPFVSSADLQIWQGQYHSGEDWNVGTFDFNFTIYNNITSGDICYSNTTSLTTDTIGYWEAVQYRVTDVCNNASINYYLNINIDGTDQDQRRLLKALKYADTSLSTLFLRSLNVTLNTYLNKIFALDWTNITITESQISDSSINNTFNQSLTDTLYTGIQWNYNQSLWDNWVNASGDTMTGDLTLPNLIATGYISTTDTEIRTIGGVSFIRAFNKDDHDEVMQMGYDTNVNYAFILAVSESYPFTLDLKITSTNFKLLTNGNLITIGNVTADYFFGNGSQLTGIGFEWNYNQTIGANIYTDSVANESWNQTLAENLFLENNSDISMPNYNITADYGFFNFLGSLTNFITKIFTQEIEMGGGNITNVTKITFQNESYGIWSNETDIIIGYIEGL